MDDNSHYSLICMIVFFIKGPGRIDLHTGKVEISTALLLAGMTYEFTAQVISADNRTGIARLMIEIIDEPYTPVISIRFVISMKSSSQQFSSIFSNQAICDVVLLALIFCLVGNLPIW